MPRWVGTLAYLASCLLFGLNLPLSAELLKHFDPFWVSPLRYLVSSVMLAGMLLVTVGPRQLRSPIPLWRVAVLSLCVAGFLVLYNLGLYRSGPLTVAATVGRLAGVRGGGVAADDAARGSNAASGAPPC